MAADIIKNWDAGTVDVPSATVPTKIATLHGGESISIKALAGDGQFHYIGTHERMTTTEAYLMDAGDVITLAHDKKFGVNSVIEIWALASNAGDDICYIKLIDSVPVTEGS